MSYEITIKDAKVYHLRAPLERPVRTAVGVMDARHLILVELVDEDGHVGIGDSWVNFPKWAPWERRAAFEQAYIPYLKGRPCNDIHSFIVEMARAFHTPCAQAVMIGPLVSALCAVELALWDLMAKAQNLPLSKLISPDAEPSARVYASGLAAPLEWPLIDRCLEDGITLFKLKIGFGPQDINTLTELTRYLGNSAQVAVDVNRAWTFEQALEWLQPLHDLGILWVEEPLRPDDEHRLAELADKRQVRMSGGENVTIEPGRDDPRACAELPLDICQPNITKSCCLSDALAMFEAAQLRGKEFYPQFLGSAPGLAANLHLAAGCGDIIQEMDVTANPLRTDLFTQPFSIVNGTIKLPDGPGLGWEIDRNMLEKFRVE
jgi:D-galactarolactone cycloisomerase